MLTIIFSFLPLPLPPPLPTIIRWHLPLLQHIIAAYDGLEKMSRARQVSKGRPWVGDSPKYHAPTVDQEHRRTPWNTIAHPSNASARPETPAQRMPRDASTHPAMPAHTPQQRTPNPNQHVHPTRQRHAHLPTAHCLPTAHRPPAVTQWGVGAQHNDNSTPKTQHDGGMHPRPPPTTHQQAAHCSPAAYRPPPHMHAPVAHLH
ncbi:hypothetical protein DXG01_005262 [Tephrocybe rancida]|nr:hypothetical protein DXG01_005262 [Tephrocybe rancida]